MKTSAQARLGAEIKRRRVEQGLTLTELGAHADVHPHFLSAIEKGRHDVGLPVLTRIAAALGTPLGLLFGPCPELTPKALAAGLLFDKAHPDLQRGILAILRATAPMARKATRAAGKAARKRTKSKRGK